MKKVFIVFIAFLMFFYSFSGGLTVSANVVYADDSLTIQYIDRVIDFNINKEKASGISDWISSVLPDRIGGTAEWYAIGLAQYPAFIDDKSGHIKEKVLSQYSEENAGVWKALNKYETTLEKYLSENDVRNATARLKFALALDAAGYKADDPGASGTAKDDFAAAYINKCMSDGTIGGLGIMSQIFGLHLVNNGYIYINSTDNENADNSRLSAESGRNKYEQWEASREELVEAVLSQQHKDGGWSVIGDYGDVDVTAMVLQALAPCCNNNDKCMKAVDSGLAFLSGKQLDNGAFMSFGTENAESTAQVLTCLAALDIDCTKDDRFIKKSGTILDGLLSFALSEGSFSHEPGGEYSATATVQAFYSLVAYVRMTAGLSPLYVLNGSRQRLDELERNADPVSENNANDDRDEKTPDEDVGQETIGEDRNDAEDNGSSNNDNDSDNNGTGNNGAEDNNVQDNSISDSNDNAGDGGRIEDNSVADGDHKEDNPAADGDHKEDNPAADADSKEDNSDTEDDFNKNNVAQDTDTDRENIESNAKKDNNVSENNNDSKDNNFLKDYNGSKDDNGPQDSNTSDNAVQNNATDTNKSKTAGYKPYAIAAILVLSLISCIIFAVRKKHRKNYLFVALTAAAAILIVIFTDFKSAADYYSDTGTVKEAASGTVTMSIKCDILQGMTDSEYVPADGIILEETEFDLNEGETVYDLLIEAARKYGISVDHKGGSEIVYISGINYLYELDYGDLSGWVYKVNGVLPSVGCAAYKLNDGDRIEWCYTLDLGNDSLK